MIKEAKVSLATASAIVIISVLIASLLMIAVTAQDEEEEILVEEEIVAEESAGVTPDSPLYVFDKIVDDIQLSLAKGDDKTKKALEIKEERISEAAVMVDKKKPDQAQSALELATKAAEQAQKDLDPELEKETNEKVRRAAKLLSGLQEKLPDQGWEGVEKAIDAQLSEEEKVRVALLVSKSRLSYCDAIAKQDFDLMKDDELCQLEKSPQWLREKVEGEFTSREENARGLIIDTVSACIVDPKKCDCSQIPVGKHSQTCEVKKALAIRCEYENDESACADLGSEKLEDFLPEFIGEEGKQTLLAHLREKEEEMFERFKPPECANVQTFQECFAVMKDLYGEPPECEGLSDDECIELMKSRPPGEHNENFPPECKEAGVTAPLECAELMFSKYGKPPQCEGLDTKECMKLMRHERPDAANFAMPPECQEAGATQPRQCFDIMTAKYGSPPECEGLDSDACFAEMMKRGPGGAGGEMMGQEPPECKEKGLKGKDCFISMMELYGTPPECEGLSTDECFQKMMKEGPKGGGGHCVGLSPEECRAKLQEQHGLPPECAENPEKCREAFAGRGVPGGLPTECAGLEKGQCELVMMKKFGPPECQTVSSKEECEAIMKEKYGSEGHGQDGMPGGEGGPGQEGRMRFEHGGFDGGFKNECEGQSREECEQTMRNKFAPPECQGQSREECDKVMREKYEGEIGERHDGEEKFRGEGGEGFDRGFEGGERGSSGMPPECQGLSIEECRSKFFKGKGQEEERGEGEHREFPPGFEKGEGGVSEKRSGQGPRRIERQPLGEPDKGMPSECQGLSSEECARTMKDKFAPQHTDQQNFPPPSEHTSAQQPSQQYPSDSYPSQHPDSSGHLGPYPSSGSYPGSGSGDSGSSSSSGGFGGDSGSASGSSGSPSGSDSGSGGESTATAITGQIVKVFNWIGGH